MEKFFSVMLLGIYIWAIAYAISLLGNKDTKIARRGKIILFVCIGLPLIGITTCCIIFILFFMTCFGLIKL